MRHLDGAKITKEDENMSKHLVAGLLALAFVALAFETPAFVTSSLADEPIKVTGCVAPGVEAKCLVLRTMTGKTYDITAAKPAPTPGTYGDVDGTLKTEGVTTCQQGPAINPATWTETSKVCPKS
jgi:hypothetical protein